MYMLLHYGVLTRARVPWDLLRWTMSRQSGVDGRPLVLTEVRGPGR